MSYHDHDFASYDHATVHGEASMWSFRPASYSCSSSASDAFEQAFFSNQPPLHDLHVDAVTFDEVSPWQLYYFPAAGSTAECPGETAQPVGARPRKGSIQRFTPTQEDIEMSIEATPSRTSSEGPTCEGNSIQSDRWA